MDGVSLCNHFVCFFTWRQEASCSSMLFCLKNQQGLKEPRSLNITWKHWFGTVLNISYVSIYKKKHCLKKKAWNIGKQNFFILLSCCHKPSVNSHQPSKEDPISQHLSNTKSLQSEADPFSFWVKSHQVVYFLCKSFSWTQPLFTSGDFHGPRKTSLPRGHALRPVATKPWHRVSFEPRKHV